MTPLQRGMLVCLLAGDDDTMPIGAVGEVLDGPDWMGDYDVEFPGHPCPVKPGTYWCCHRSWLIPIGGPPLAIGKYIHTELEDHLCESTSLSGWQPSLYLGDA